MQYVPFAVLKNLFTRNVDKNSFAVADIAKVLLSYFFHVIRKLLTLIALNLLQIIGFYLNNIYLLTEFAELRSFLGDFYILVDDGDNGIKYKSDCREIKQDIARLMLLFRLCDFLGAVGSLRGGRSVCFFCFWFSQAHLTSFFSNFVCS